MLKLGLIAPSARKIQPTPDEQPQILINHGVVPENILRLEGGDAGEG